MTTSYPVRLKVGLREDFRLIWQSSDDLTECEVTFLIKARGQAGFAAFNNISPVSDFIHVDGSDPGPWTVTVSIPWDDFLLVVGTDASGGSSYGRWSLNITDTALVERQVLSGTWFRDEG